MPQIKMSKESLEGPPPIADGLVELRLEGFQPKKSKAGTSINLNPQLKIVNNAQYNGRQVFDNLNTGASWILEAFCHAFGIALEPDGNGGFAFPGGFFPENEPDPEKWTYSGPLLGLVGKAFLKQTEYNGRTNSRVDQWVCSAQGCTSKHPTGLAK
jgi:hypothetical protein